MRSMVGLSVILENCKDLSSKRSPRVVSKGSTIKPPSPTTNLSPNNGFSKSGFLDRCFLCNQKLLPGKDIYMYKGDKGFCSVECRCRQIFMDEEEGCTREYNNCSLAATTNSSQSSSSRTSGKGARNRANNNAFAY